MNLLSFLTAMDPNNIHSQSSSLLGLLQSQQGSIYHGGINFGDSQPLPSFSTQPSQVPPVARGVRRKWDHLNLSKMIIDDPCVIQVA